MLEFLRSFYQRLLDSGEPHVKQWFLVRDPLHSLYLTLAYLLLVTWIGPQLMKHRKPFQLKPLIMAHNLMLVCINAYIFYQSGDMGWFDLRTYTRCFVFREVDGEREAFVFYVYYISKYLDWIDTFFLVLRKKTSHITFLHLYHHATMPIATWLFLFLSPGGVVSLGGFLNSFVHVVMYSYYFLASLGPHMRPYLWWKEYLTLLQLLQFVIGSIHGTQWLFRECHHPIILTYIICLNGLFFLFLFTLFYIETYRKNIKDKKK